MALRFNPPPNWPAPPDGFGASAPLKDLLVKFGFTVDAVIAAARQQIEKSKERQS